MQAENSNNATTPWWDQMASQLWLVVTALILITPVGLFLLYRGRHFETRTRHIVALIAVVWMLMYSAYSVNSPETSEGYNGSSCAATFEQNGCTYYRDDHCNVVARSCE